jgi:RES domain-containing protein
VYRRAFAEGAFSGEGARHTGGRWNSKGVSVVYAAESLALALLEIVVAVGGISLPKDYLYASVEIPSGIRVEHVDPVTLPSRWYVYPAPHELAECGDRWIHEGKSVALVVPSAITRIEENVLLNPAHADFKHLVISGAKPVPVDTRLIKMLGVGGESRA